MELTREELMGAKVIEISDESHSYEGWGEINIDGFVLELSDGRKVTVNSSSRASWEGSTEDWIEVDLLR